MDTITGALLELVMQKEKEAYIKGNVELSDILGRVEDYIKESQDTLKNYRNMYEDH
jgi:hypothetical protein